MNIFELLKKDHRKFLRLIKEIELTPENQASQCEKLFYQLNSEIINNTFIEEKVFYNALESLVGNHTSLKTALEEHKSINYLLQELKFIRKESKEWRTKIVQLKETLIQHIENEEDEIFHIARCMLDKPQIDQLSWQIKCEKLKSRQLLKAG